MSLPLIHSLYLEELTEYCQSAGFPHFRAKQIWHWLYNKHATTWDAMHNIPPAIRQNLNQNFAMPPYAGNQHKNTKHKTQTKQLDIKTKKLLVKLSDGDSVEAVIIPSSRPGTSRYTICISCQVGCRFNCAFCASGKAGLSRNLKAGEMISQVIAAINLTGEPPSNIVFMGIGEPFDNYDNTIKAARILNDSNGLKIGARKITISTSGIIPGIKRFAAEGPQFELSVSLHAPNNAIRSQLMPINNTYPLPELITACKKYTRNTNRIITFEYTLIRDINDKLDHAYQLAKLLRGFHCRVNLIPLSPIAEFNGEPSTNTAAQNFIDTLENAHINTTLRRSQGASQKAACGQLRFAKRKTT